MVSQVLTLYTTPVVYLWFDRLASTVPRLLRFRGRRAQARGIAEPAAAALNSDMHGQRRV